jgi:hypothetical protein
MIEYLSSLASFADCYYVDNYSYSAALKDTSVRTCFILGILVRFFCSKSVLSFVVICYMINTLQYFLNAPYGQYTLLLL